MEVGQSIGQIGSLFTVNGNVRTQLIAHEKPVHDIAFARIGNGRDQFGTAGADGSLRLFDLRSLQHSTILYEDGEKRPLNRIAWNKIDAMKVATVAHESNEVVVLDVRTCLITQNWRTEKEFNCRYGCRVRQLRSSVATGVQLMGLPGPHTPTSISAQLGATIKR